MKKIKTAPKREETDQSIEKELSRLDVELMVQKMLMAQAKKALSVSSFSKCTQEGQLEAEKALLLTCKWPFNEQNLSHNFYLRREM